MKRFKKIAAVAVAVIMILSAVLMVACEKTPPVVVEDPVLDSISITKQPTKAEYTDGESFDKAGIEVTAKYDDGTSKVVTGWTASKGALKEGDTEVVITYTEAGVSKTAPVSVTVNPKPPVVVVTLISIAVKTNPTKLTYEEGELFSAAGLVIEASYSDLSKKEVTGFDWNLKEALKVADKRIVVSYTEGDVTKEVEILITVNAKPVEPPVAEAKVVAITDSTLLPRFKVALMSDNTLTFTFVKQGAEAADTVVKGIELVEVPEEVVSPTKTNPSYFKFAVAKNDSEKYVGTLSKVITTSGADIGKYTVSVKQDVTKNAQTIINEQKLTPSVAAGYIKGSDTANTIELLSTGILKIKVGTYTTLCTEIAEGSYEAKSGTTVYSVVIAGGKVNMKSFTRAADGAISNEKELVKDKDFLAVCTCGADKHESKSVAKGAVGFYHINGEFCKGYNCDFYLSDKSESKRIPCNCEDIAAGGSAEYKNKEKAATFELRNDKILRVIIGSDVVEVTVADKFVAATAEADAILQGEFKFELNGVNYYGLLLDGQIKSFLALSENEDPDTIIVPVTKPITLKLCPQLAMICPDCGGKVKATVAATDTKPGRTKYEGDFYNAPKFDCICEDIKAGVQIVDTVVVNTYAFNTDIMEIILLNNGTLQARPKFSSGSAEFKPLVLQKDSTEIYEYKTSSSAAASYLIKIVVVDGVYTVADVQAKANNGGWVSKLAAPVELAPKCTGAELCSKCGGLLGDAEPCDGYECLAYDEQGALKDPCNCEVVDNGGIRSDELSGSEIARFELRKDGKLNLIIDGLVTVISPASKDIYTADRTSDAIAQPDKSFLVPVGDAQLILRLKDDAKKILEYVPNYNFDPEAECGGVLDDEHEEHISSCYLSGDYIELLPVCTDGGCGVEGHCKNWDSIYGECDACAVADGAPAKSYACVCDARCDCDDLLFGWDRNQAGSTVAMVVELFNDGRLEITISTLDTEVIYDADGFFSFTASDDKNYEGYYNALTRELTLIQLAKPRSVTAALGADSIIVPAGTYLKAACDCNVHVLDGYVHANNIKADGTSNCQKYGHDQSAITSALAGATDKAKLYACDCAKIVAGFVDGFGNMIEQRKDGTLEITLANEQKVLAELAEDGDDYTFRFRIGAVKYVGTLDGDGEDAGLITINIFDDDDTPVIVDAELDADDFILAPACACGTAGCEEWIFEFSGTEEEVEALEAEYPEGACPCKLAANWKCNCTGPSARAIAHNDGAHFFIAGDGTNGAATSECICDFVGCGVKHTTSAPSAAGCKCTVEGCGRQLAHTWIPGTVENEAGLDKCLCSNCGAKKNHVWNASAATTVNHVCKDCTAAFAHVDEKKGTNNTQSGTNCICDICNYVMHTWNEGNTGVCDICGTTHGCVAADDFNADTGACKVCGKVHTPHDWEAGECEICGYECAHGEYAAGVCTVCGIAHTPHSWTTDGTDCTCACGATHSYVPKDAPDGYCNECNAYFEGWDS
jgi:hypothetical protein